MPKKSREFSMDEPTMAEKLSSLELLNKDKLEIKSIPGPAATVEPPRADSLHILLKQALHADDHSLLLDCLYTRDEKVDLLCHYLSSFMNRSFISVYFHLKVSRPQQ